MPEQTFFLLDELDFIVSNVTAIIMLLTLVSLLIANLARYVQAKKYGVPLKMVHQASIPDSLDIWITLITVLGFGVIIPLAMLSVNWHSLFVFPVIYISCLLGKASTKANFARRIKDKDGITQVVSYNWTFYASAALPTTVVLTYIHFIIGSTGGYETSRSIPQVILMVIAIIVLTLDALLILASLVNNMYEKIFGNQDIMTVEIDNQLYLIALRHVSNYWILMPCTLGKAEDKGSINIGETSEEEKLVDAILFSKGKFIVRDISLLDGSKNILCRDRYKLVGIKE